MGSASRKLRRKEAKAAQRRKGGSVAPGGRRARGPRPEGRRGRWDNIDVEMALMRKPPGERDLPEDYIEQIKVLAQAICDWHAAHPGLDLRWKEEVGHRDLILTGPIDDPRAADAVADSEDARRMLREVDAQTGGFATLMQVTWALRMARVVRLPDGGYYGVEDVFESEGLRALRQVARDIRDSHEANDRQRFQTKMSECGHCRRPLDQATGIKGTKPSPGMASVCVFCAGINYFDDQLDLHAATEEWLGELDPENRDYLLEVSNQLRQTILQGTLVNEPKTRIEA